MKQLKQEGNKQTKMNKPLTIELMLLSKDTLPEETLADNTACNCPRCRGPRERARVRARSRMLKTASERRAWRKLTDIDPHFQLLYQQVRAPLRFNMLRGRPLVGTLLAAFAYFHFDRAFDHTPSVGALRQRINHRIKRGCYDHLFN